MMKLDKNYKANTIIGDVGLGSRQGWGHSQLSCVVLAECFESWSC